MGPRHCNKGKPIVLLTSEIYRNKDNKWRSDLDGHITYSAGAEIYKKEGGLSKIVICGGKINGKDCPVLSEVMKKELIRRHKISEGSIYIEGKSVDTSENAENCKKLLDTMDLEKDVILVTRDYHLRRSKHLFENYGFNVEVRSAEEILKEKSKGHKKLMDQFQKSCKYFEKRILNFGLNTLLYLPNGYGEKVVREKVHREIDKKGRRDFY